MMYNNLNLDHANIIAYTNGKILSICSWDIERKRKGEVNQGVRSGSVVECSTQDWGAAGSSLTVVTV